MGQWLLLASQGTLCCCLQVNATQDVEARICERLHIGGHVTYKRLLEDMQALGYSGSQVGHDRQTA